MKATHHYLEATRRRPDRTEVLNAWIELDVYQPANEAVQSDDRIRRWAPIDEAGGRQLRVALIPDAETFHNAFFDRKSTA